MKKINLFLLFIFLSSLLINAQIKVTSTGKMILGNEVTVTPNDPDNITSMQIFGKNGDSRAGSKLSFGDFGRQVNNGMNVMIGEYGTGDSDQLWLHGKNGIFFTNGPGNVFASYDLNSGNRFDFNCNVYSWGVKLASDERFKENITPLNSSLSLLTKIKGVSYNFNDSVPNSMTKSLENSQEPIAEKELKDKANLEKLNKEISAQKEKRHLGFIAQELKEVFPELVEEGKDGYMYVDYIGLIPVIVESIKEQSQIIESQKVKINELEEMVSTVMKESGQPTSISSILGENQHDAILYQNTPNPFNDNTIIKYQLPENTQNAYICIYDMQGALVKKIPAYQGEDVEIQGSDLNGGMYLYSLVINGKEIDTKKMILRK